MTTPAASATPAFPAPDEVAAAARPVAHDRRWERMLGVAIAGLVLLIFLVSNPNRHNFYEHFTWQAAAWLEGQAGIRYPVCPSTGVATFAGVECIWVADEGQPYNDYFLDVLPLTTPGGHLTGRALIPFPPLPAVLLTPLVAIWGLATDAQTLAALVGGLDVWIAWWLLGALRPGLRIRAAATLFFGLGTVFWYTSMLGTTWYVAHVVAVGLTLLAVGIALRADRAAVDRAAVDQARGAVGADRAAAARARGAGGGGGPPTGGRGGGRGGVAPRPPAAGGRWTSGRWWCGRRRRSGSA